MAEAELLLVQYFARTKGNHNAERDNECIHAYKVRMYNHPVNAHDRLMLRKAARGRGLGEKHVAELAPAFGCGVTCKMLLQTLGILYLPN